MYFQSAKKMEQFLLENKKYFHYNIYKLTSEKIKNYKLFLKKNFGTFIAWSFLKSFNYDNMN